MAEFELKPDDLDVLGHNSRSEPGDELAERIESSSSESGPDDGDGLGISNVPNEWKP